MNVIHAEFQVGGKSVAEVISTLIKVYGLPDVLATIGFVIEVDQKTKQAIDYYSAHSTELDC